ncbi:uncharacterized protein LOC118749773 [Rhagoletis pomonella]|uniref:uncharacterized protein LOC118749773 n=1 Tax=Rhagoletis pomonella TaxID=28610 RepID=UPI001785099D|nr:uncharacterized protein LOC118749773 [Rhagoletis pomonella]
MSEVEDLKNEIIATTPMQNTPPQSVLPQIPLPGPPNIKDGDISENLRYFKQQWQNYLSATGLVHQHEEANKAILLTAVGDEVFKRYANMPIPEAATSTASSLLHEIEKHGSNSHI